ncbi:MAG: hypothetical protein GW795_12310 [Cyanobacteria bacterium]|nr:hypothetical protein [Cyanobacteria bacterium CG_2015-16_32_12]NCO78974.1 hypothetical protein [Cyanobacteria bacterium CG_2015-22_32_23]NCQ03101.1 hypothetical protein [Cyanobacteria bacterium CG_2015-09_32_10]NCQ42627.1 hypothetical protein [Cyanobacteria bacterium CG_2015-04_32_10]NCS83760.1 hypothetical protein [Cyanobacteria bacterium CG_2015-02_32_10]
MAQIISYLHLPLKLKVILVFYAVRFIKKDQNLSQEDFDARIQRLQQLLTKTHCCLMDKTNEINNKTKELIRS